MTRYPTDPIVLAALSDEEWQTVLADAWFAPPVRAVVRFQSEPPSRRDRLIERLAAGETKADVARAWGVSPGLISKIMKGERN